MGRINYINLVEQIYRANPMIADDTIIGVIHWIFGEKPSRGTVQVWKTKMRKKRIAIPDRRKKK